MLQITKIVLNSQTCLDSFSFSMHSVTGELDDSYKNLSVVITIYDDMEGSFDIVTLDFFAKSIALFIKYKGATVKTDKGFCKVVIKPCYPSYIDIIRLKSVQKISDKTYKFNTNFTNKLGVDDNCHFVMIGSNKGMGNCLLCITETGDIRTFSDKDVANQLSSHSDDVIYLDETFIISSINISNSINFYYSYFRNIVKILSRGIYSIMDLYELTVLAPDLATGCSVPSSTEFIVDTLTDRYVFNVKEGIRNYILKNKLLNS